MSRSDAAQPTDDEQPPQQSPAGESAPAEESGPAARAAEISDETGEDGAEDDLPEWEPLTPELVEEEAIRGDFMLRWASILLAMLMGWTIIDRTEVLVHVRSGQYLATHGFLPPRTDVLSATASDRRWVNLSWLWDVIVGGIEAAVGPAGLSVFAAWITLATFWIIARISVPGVPTWWGSVLAVLAAVASFPSLTATPHLVTLLGVAWTLWLLYRWQWDESTSLWPLVGLFVLWANLDSRAWIGGVILLLFALGTWIDGFRNFPAEERKPLAKTVGLVTLCSLLALLVHPFLWETWLSPLRLYSIEYPALRSYASSDLTYAFERYSVASKPFWSELNLSNAMSMLLMLIAGVTAILNRERLRASTALALLGINMIGIAGGRELAVASIVNAIVATINAQQWYRSTFRQTYSVETGELVFSRGGRALTVLAIFGLAFAVVSGHFMGADGRRVGMGLAPDIANQIDSYQSLLADAFDDRAFNFRLQQGDVLIWIGMKPFIDSRVRLYGGGESLVALHQQLRQALREAASGPEARASEGTGILSGAESTNISPRELWTNAFDRSAINLALPRMSGDAPDYVTFFSLLNSRDWQLTEQAAASASFYRTNSGNEDLAAYLKKHEATNFVSRFLQTDSTPTENERPPRAFPTPPSFYDRYVYLPQKTVPNGVKLAEHYMVLRDAALQNQRYSDAAALAYAAIRSARDGLREDPDHAAGYQILATSYQLLELLENSVQRSRGMPSPLNIRFYQTISSFHDGLACGPPNPERVHYQLFETYDAHERYDLALTYLELVEKATGSTSILSVSDPKRVEQQERNDTRMAELRERVDQVREQTVAQLQSQADRLAVAQGAYSNGCPLIALEVLEEDLTLAATNPLVRLQIGVLLFEVGRTAEALEQLETLRGTPLEEQSPDWPIMAAYANLAADDLTTAQSTLEASHSRIAQTVTAGLLESLPLRFVGPAPTPEGTLGWGDGEAFATVRQIQTVALMESMIGPQLEQNEVLRALIAVEVGDITNARQLFEQAVDRNPHTALRPMIEQYLQWVAGRQLPPPPQIEGPPEVPDLFAEESANEEQPGKGGDQADASADEPNQPPDQPEPPASNDAPQDSTDDRSGDTATDTPVSM